MAFVTVSEAQEKKNKKKLNMHIPGYSYAIDVPSLGMHLFSAKTCKENNDLASRSIHYNLISTIVFLWYRRS